MQSARKKPFVLQAYFVDKNTDKRRIVLISSGSHHVFKKEVLRVVNAKRTLQFSPGNSKLASADCTGPADEWFAFENKYVGDFLLMSGNRTCKTGGT